jgi:hypothetical protein
MNKEKPFADALRMAIRGGNNPHRLRAIAEKLIEKAEQGDLQAIREIADRLDGKSTQVIDRGESRLETMSDAELLVIAKGGFFNAQCNTCVEPAHPNGPLLIQSKPTQGPRLGD